MAIITTIGCDDIDCSNVIELDGPYHTVKEEMKKIGWINRKVKGTDGKEKWVQFCSDHRKEKS